MSKYFYQPSIQTTMKRKYQERAGVVAGSSLRPCSEISESRERGRAKKPLTMPVRILTCIVLLSASGMVMSGRSHAAEKVKGKVAPLAAVGSATAGEAAVKPKPVEAKVQEEVGAPAQGLSLRELLVRVAEKNDEIQAQKLEWLANRRLLNSARGIYEPTLKASLSREGNHLENTIKEKLNQRYASEYREINNLGNLSVEGLTPLGGTYRVGYNMKKLQNNLWLTTESTSSYNIPEYVSFLGVNLTQPLLKGAGPGVTNANIRIAGANEAIAFESYRRSMVETLAKAVQLYWQCYGAQEKLKMRKRSMEIASDMLQMNNKRYIAGKIDYTAVMDAESGLRLRQALVAAAEQTELTARNNLLTLTGESGSGTKAMAVRVTDAPESQPFRIDMAQSLSTAYKSYPQYLSAQKSVERESARSSYADNQRLPQLDVKGSYGLNGLDATFGDSWNKAVTNDYISWSVGVELSVPLLGDIRSRNESGAARLRNLQAQKRLDIEKVDLANQMEIVTGLVGRVYSQVQNYEKIVALNESLWKAEEMRFKMGKSDVRMLLGREEDLLKARESLLDSRLAYQYALVNFYALEGTLPEHYGLSAADPTQAEQP